MPLRFLLFGTATVWDFCYLGFWLFGTIPILTWAGIMGLVCLFQKQIAKTAFWILVKLVVGNFQSLDSAQYQEQLYISHLDVAQPKTAFIHNKKPLEKNPVSLSKQAHHNTDLRPGPSTNISLSGPGKIKQGSRALGKIVNFPDSHGRKVNMVIMSHLNSCLPMIQ